MNFTLVWLTPKGGELGGLTSSFIEEWRWKEKPDLGGAMGKAKHVFRLKQIRQGQRTPAWGQSDSEGILFIVCI